jgi:hypothetical protein
MKGKHCRLYDEQLVKNILITAGLSVYDLMTEKGVVDEEDICEFLEANADTIILDTIEDLNQEPPPMPPEPKKDSDPPD